MSRGEHNALHWLDGQDAPRLRRRVAYLEGLLDEAGISYEKEE